MNCPNCGSSNVTYNREKKGELKGKGGSAIVRETVGVCKDCGYTWTVAADQLPKKRKTWLWVLGWLFIFPIPLTILMLRKKDMKPALKYGIIAAGWIVYLLLAYGGQANNKQSSTTSEPPAVVETQTDEKQEEVKEEIIEEAEETEAAVEEEVEETAAEEDSSTEAEVDDATVEFLMENTESILKENFGEDNYSLSRDGDIVTINVWQDGIAVGAMGAASGNEELKDGWNNMLSNMEGMAKSSYDLYKPYNMNVNVNILNDQNKEKVLASYYNGILIYDSVAEQF